MGAEFDVLLYDRTSSYVEGAAEKDPMLQRGYSRDHRPDGKQVVIALIVNAEGFPWSYETFDGNRADVSRLEAVMRMVERKYGRARRVWVFDRGIVSEENLAALRRRNGQYLVQRRQSPLTPARALALLATVQSADIVLPTTEGREIRLRRVTTPSPEQSAILDLLGITLPQRFDLNFECSVNSPTA